MMKLRVIDYVGNPGGGIRFGVELLKALRDAHHDVQIELVSHGEALKSYRSALESELVNFSTIDIRPVNMPATRTLGIPGTARLKQLLGFGTNWYDVPDTALENCDVAWFPWIHRHRIPGPRSHHVVGSFHDAIIFLWPNLVPDHSLEDERRTLRGWVESRARIVVSSHATLATVLRLFGTREERFLLIPVAGSHLQASAHRGDLAKRPHQFLLCPANTSPHKNHEVLFRGMAASGLKVPLLLTGHGTKLRAIDGRQAHLRRLARSLGLRAGDSLIPLGYVSDEAYRNLLSRAWAVVMPSLMEGGGSFPVVEALHCGIPVVCSDIPVLREQIGLTGGEVLWFNPHDAMDLAKKLQNLRDKYTTYKTKATAQAPLLRRTWKDVADEYWDVMKAIGSRL
jgi:glycosyltransferase involved in cell wall biosynthesis